MNHFVLLLTDAEFCFIIFLGEIVTVTENDLASPGIQVGPNHQIAVLVEFCMNGTSLERKVQQ